MYYTSNPVIDFLRYDLERAEKELELPVCDICGETQEDHFYEIDGRRLCADCLDDIYRREVDIDG